jgi:hypothetical protein
MFGRLRVPIVASLSLALLSACAGGGENVPSASVALTDVAAQHRPAARTSSVERVAKAKNNGPTLYVMNSGQTAGAFSITVYSLGGAKLLRTISVGKSGKSGSVAFAVGADGLL